MELVTAKAQELTVKDSVQRVEEEGPAKPGPTDSTSNKTRKPHRSEAAKRRARKARLALQGPDSEPHRKDEGRGANVDQRSSKRPRPSDSTPPEKHTTAKKSRFSAGPTGYADAAATLRKQVWLWVPYLALRIVVRCEMT